MTQDVPQEEPSVHSLWQKVQQIELAGNNHFEVLAAKVESILEHLTGQGRPAYVQPTPWRPDVSPVGGGSTDMNEHDMAPADIAEGAPTPSTPPDLTQVQAPAIPDMTPVVESEPSGEAQQAEPLAQSPDAGQASGATSALPSEPPAAPTDHVVATAEAIGPSPETGEQTTG